MKIKSLLLLSIFLCCLYSCDKSENQDKVDVAGTYKGTYSSSLVGITDFMLIINQDGNTISGNYYSDISTGTISGSVDGSNLTFTLTQTTSYCTGTFTGSGTISGNTISFSFQGTDCLGTHTMGSGVVLKESSGTDLPEFSFLDLAGTWTGTAYHPSYSATLTLTVTNNGNVSGSAVTSTWAIDSKGTVTGGGSYSLMLGSTWYDANTSWLLQLDESKQKLTGVLVVYVGGLQLNTALVKQ